MNKLPKEIYVDENADEPIFFTNPEECAVSGETVTLAVYKLVGKVEVSTQVKTEVVVKKSPAKKAAAKQDKRNPLVNEMQITHGTDQLVTVDPMLD